jgi:hypothetical protein
LPDSHAEKRIQDTIVAGSVYYFHEESIASPKQHRFIVLNCNPLSDTAIILVCASKQIEYFKRLRRDFPSETLVEIEPSQYPGFTQKSIIDCNRVFPKQLSDIANRLKRKKLQILQTMGLRLVRELRKGVLLSSQIDEETKDLLREDTSSQD